MNAQPQTDSPRAMLDIARLARSDTQVVREPFHCLVACAQLADGDREPLRSDFPAYAGAGFFPWDAADCGPAVNALVGELTSPAFADAIGCQLGLPDLGSRPTLVTLCRALNRRHGTIHTDSRSKIATALLYLNEHWNPEDGGCLRLLRREDDIDSLVVPEIPPLYGQLVVFRRSDCSFHGHLPFEGERRVIQVAWLASEADVRRKTRRGRLSRFVKWVTGKLDRNWGRER
jgi:hypothetical protein